MSEFCTTLYPFIVLGVIVVLFCGLALGQQFQMRRKQNRDLDKDSTRLLLAMLMIAIISMAIFVAYIFGPRTVC